MKLDTSLRGSFDAVASAAAGLEAEGYDGVWIGETQHEPFLQCLQAIQATTDVTIGTSIAIAFARTPMTLANVGYDLARYSKGRFVLGLGSQIKPHIERRFSMPWSHPAPRMRELIQGMRAIWNSGQTGEKLDFRGEFYTHTLMTPFFAPPAHEYGAPPVFLAGVGNLMTQVAGEVADGFFIHPFTTRRYLDEVTLPALRAGREKGGHSIGDGWSLGDFTVCGPSFVTVGRNEQEMATAVTGTKKQIAFYASTPAYRGVLELHGWGDLQPELTRLSKAGGWDEMGELITDDMLHTFSVVGTPDEVGAALRKKLGDLAQRITCYATYDVDPAVWGPVRDALRA
jgi:probable F420-dependent oxidoreductase